MKFRFTGGVDCPDWLLVDVAILSTLPLEAFSALVGAVLGHLLGREFQWGDALETAKQAGLDLAQAKQATCGLQYVVSNSTRFHCDSATVKDEMTMIGLPSELADSLALAYSEAYEELQHYAAEDFPRLPTVSSMDWIILKGDSGESSRSAVDTAVELRLCVGKPRDSIPEIRGLRLKLSREKLLVLVHELQAALQLMCEAEEGMV
eukprot:RCo003927